MPIEWKPQPTTNDRRQDAEQRIAARDRDDWPTDAVAQTLGLPVWSQDKDLASAGASGSTVSTTARNASTPAS